MGETDMTYTPKKPK